MVEGVGVDMRHAELEVDCQILNFILSNVSISWLAPFEGKIRFTFTGLVSGAGDIGGCFGCRLRVSWSKLMRRVALVCGQYLSTSSQLLAVTLQLLGTDQDPVIEVIGNLRFEQAFIGAFFEIHVGQRVR